MPPPPWKGHGCPSALLVVLQHTPKLNPNPLIDYLAASNGWMNPQGKQITEGVRRGKKKLIHKEFGSKPSIFVRGDLLVTTKKTHTTCHSRHFLAFLGLIHNHHPPNKNPGGSWFPRTQISHEVKALGLAKSPWHRSVGSVTGWE